MSAIGARICSPSAEACHVTQTHFLVRAGKSRRVQESEEEITYSLDRARSGRAREAVYWSFPLGMVTQGARHSSSFPLVS